MCRSHGHVRFVLRHKVLSSSCSHMVMSYFRITKVFFVKEKDNTCFSFGPGWIWVKYYYIAIYKIKTLKFVYCFGGNIVI